MGTGMSTGTSIGELSRPLQSNADVHFEADSKRWLMLMLFTILTSCVGVLWLTFAPIAKQTDDYLGRIGELAIIMLSVSFQLAYVLGTLSGMYIIAKYGIRATVLIGSSFAVLSATVRYLAVVLFERKEINATCTYIFLLCGQILGGLGYPLFSNIPAKIAGQWFPVKERDMATTICSLALPLGTTLPQILSPAFVHGGGDNAVIGMEPLMLTTLLMCFIPFVFSAWLFEARPLGCPSRSTYMRWVLSREKAQFETLSDDIRADLKELFSNPEFRVLACISSVELAVIYALLTLVQKFVEPLGYDGGIAGLYGTTFIVFGSISATFTGYMLDKTHMYRQVLKWAVVSALASVFIFGMLLRDGSAVAVCAAFAVLGFCSLPVLPAVLENCVECTYPISEERSIAILFGIGGLLGAPATVLLMYALNHQASFPRLLSPALGVMLFTHLLCCVSVNFYQGDYRRLQAEDQVSGGNTRTEEQAQIMNRFMDNMVIGFHGGGSSTFRAAAAPISSPVRYSDVRFGTYSDDLDWASSFPPPDFSQPLRRSVYDKSTSSNSQE